MVVSPLMYVSLKGTVTALRSAEEENPLTESMTTEAARGHVDAGCSLQRVEQRMLQTRCGREGDNNQMPMTNLYCS